MSPLDRVDRARNSFSEPALQRQFTPIPQADAASGGLDDRASQRDDRAAQAAGRQAQGGFESTASAAEGGDTAARDAFAKALTGQVMRELSIQDQLIIDQLIATIAAGQVDPSFVAATVGDLGNSTAETRLASGARGAFVPAEGGGQGTALLSRDIIGTDSLRGVALEEFGGAVVDQAQTLGLTVAPGDAGARLAIVVSGGDLDRVPNLFTAKATDTGRVLLDGSETRATLQTGTTTTFTNPAEFGWTVSANASEGIIVQAYNNTTASWVDVWTKPEGLVQATVSGAGVPGNISDYGASADVQFRIINTTTGTTFSGADSNQTLLQRSLNGKRLSFDDRTLAESSDRDFNDIVVTTVAPGTTSPFDPVATAPVVSTDANSYYPLVTASFATPERVEVWASIRSGDGVWREVLLFNRADTSIKDVTLKVPVNEGEQVGEIFIRTDRGVERREGSPGPVGPAPQMKTQNDDGSWSQRFETGNEPRGDYLDVVIGYNPADPARESEQLYYAPFGDSDPTTRGFETYSITDFGPTRDTTSGYKLQIREVATAEINASFLPPDYVGSESTTRSGWQDFQQIDTLVSKDPRGGILADIAKPTDGTFDLDMRIVDASGNVVAGSEKPGSVIQHRAVDGQVFFHFDITGNGKFNDYQAAARGSNIISPWSSLRTIYEPASGAPVFTPVPVAAPVSTDPFADLEALEADYLWAPSETITLDGVETSVMTETDLRNKIRQHVAVSIPSNPVDGTRPTAAQVEVETTIIADNMGRLHGSMIAKEGGDGYYIFTQEDIGAIASLGSLDDVVKKGVAADGIVAHEKPGFWKSVWGDLGNPSAVLSDLADAVGVEQNKLAKFLNGDMTVAEITLEGLENLGKAVFEEVKANLELRVGYLEQFYGAITANPALSESGKAFVLKAYRDAKLAGSDVMLGGIMIAMSKPKAEAATILNNAGTLLKLATEIPALNANEMGMKFEAAMETGVAATESLFSEVFGSSADTGGLSQEQAETPTANSARQMAPSADIQIERDFTPEVAARFAGFEPQARMLKTTSVDNTTAPKKIGTGFSQYLGREGNEGVRFDYAVDVADIGYTSGNPGVFGGIDDVQLRAFVTHPKIAPDGTKSFDVRIRALDANYEGGNARGVSLVAGTIGVHDYTFSFTKKPGKDYSRKDSLNSTFGLAIEGGVQPNKIPQKLLENATTIATRGNALMNGTLGAGQFPGWDIGGLAPESALSFGNVAATRFAGLFTNANIEAGTGGGFTSSYNFSRMNEDSKEDLVAEVVMVELLSAVVPAVGAFGVLAFTPPGEALVKDDPQAAVQAVHFTADVGTFAADVGMTMTGGTARYSQFSAAGFSWLAGKSGFIADGELGDMEKIAADEVTSERLNLLRARVQLNNSYSNEVFHKGSRYDNE